MGTNRPLFQIRAAIPIANDRLLTVQKKHEERKTFVPTITLNVVKSRWYNVDVFWPASILDAAKLFVVPITQTISADRQNTCRGEHFTLSVIFYYDI